jgi:hypothetical protein
MRAGDRSSSSNVALTIVAISNTLYQHGSARVLVGLLVFKTSAPVTSWWVGSIPMHFRQSSKISGGGFGGNHQSSNFFIELLSTGFSDCR